MQAFLDTFVALFPLYVYVLIGVLLRKLGLLHDELNKQVNKLVFRVFLPCSLFKSAYGITFELGGNGKAILYMVVSYAVLFTVLMLVVPRLFRDDRPAAATVVQAGFRSNFVLLGLAYTQLLFGDDNISSVSVLTAVIIPMYNILAILGFELLRGGKVNALQVLKRIVTNPLIVAVVLGLAVKAVGITLPEMILKPVEALAGVASPLALIVIGATLTVSGFRKNLKRVLGTTCLRLVAVPLVFVTIAVLLGFRDVLLVTMVVAFAGPCAVSGVPMAYELGGDGDLAGQVTATTTLLSLFSVYLFIAILRAMGFCVA